MKTKFSTKLWMTVFLALSISMVTIAMPTTTGQQTPAKVKTFPFIFATPNPVGVGAETLFAVGIDVSLATAADGWEGLSITIERPDGHVDKIENIRTDSTGSTGSVYVPPVVGTYYATMHFPEQTVKRAGMATFPVGTILLESTTEKYELVVTEEQLPNYPAQPLPTEYWTRPIHAMLWDWSPIAGNWVQWTNWNRLALGNEDAPETGHILWTKEYQMGGLVGAEQGLQSVEDGAAYETKFTNAIAIGGTLYYNERQSAYPTKRTVAVDIRTGEERWNKELKTPDGKPHSLSFGQVFYWDSYNYHGVFYFLWAAEGGGFGASTPQTCYIFDATTGDWAYTMTDVPAGTGQDGDQFRGSKGEIFRYTVNTANGWMTMWNSSRVVSNEGSFNPWGRTYNGTQGIMWNVTIPKNLPGTAVMSYPGDCVIGMNGTAFGRMVVDCVTNWALDVSPGNEGHLKWINNWKPTMDDAVMMRTAGLGSTEDRVFARYCQTTRQWVGFDMDTGKQLWITEQMEPFDYFTFATVWDGKLYDVGYGGILFCWDFKTGETIWKHEIKDLYNENLYANNWGSYSQFFIADGKVYVGSGEHSPIDPKYRGAPFTCINATTGEEIFRLSSAYNSYMGSGFLIGDSVAIFMNTYDLQVYAIGKGPSTTTVSIQNDVTTLGNKVLIKGTVMDVSPGTKDANRLLRFPNGVPAVADENASEWMQYVYQQFALPANTMGVPVSIDVIDENGNFRNIGTTTTDAKGIFSLAWAPDIPGNYKVYATFAGSNSYWQSSAETALFVDAAPATPTPQATQPASLADQYILPGIIGIIVAIVIGFAVSILILRKRP